VITVCSDVAIPEGEIAFTATRSSGPGGQNVNKVATRVTLLFDLDGSPSLSAAQKARLRQRLAGRISKEGVLRVTSQRHRSQAANRQEALERFVELLRWALQDVPPRRPTKVPAPAKRRRLEAKQRRSRLKAQRSAPLLEE
jgi:ribosome-associated protein